MTRAWFLPVFTLLVGGLGACTPPDDWEIIDTEPPGDETEVVTGEAVAGAFVDIQCHGKHERHAISSFTDEGARFTRSGDNETFEHLDTSCNRVEVDTNVHYKTGTHTFEGDVKIGDVNGQSVVQIFNAPRSGPIMMIKAFAAGGGTLKKFGGSVTLITGVTDDFVHVKIVHNLEANTLTIFINGKNAWSGGGGAGGGFNLKYGNYGTGAPTKVQWRNVSW
jgi:hypothetical protein